VLTCIAHNHEVRALYLDPFPRTREAHALCGQEKKNNQRETPAMHPINCHRDNPIVLAERQSLPPWKLLPK